MGYINVASGGGNLVVNAEPGFFLYIAITIPLVLVILGGYIWWDWRSMRNLSSQVPMQSYIVPVRDDIHLV